MLNWMKLKEHKTRFGWPEFAFVGFEDATCFAALGAWLRREGGAWSLRTVEDPLGDAAYWDLWLGGLFGGRVVLHFHYAVGIVLYATGPMSSRALRALRPRLEQLNESRFTQARCA